ncbi:MAG: aminotransferase class, partial [Sediminibacterium sp.]|nr:aminotransferase class [Sediminibacterium sp.]
LVTATPTFNILPGTARKLGTKVIEVPLTAGKVHDLPAMLRAINNETQLVYICNPANPTGTIVSPAALKDFCLEAAKKAVVVVDEAYIDFLNPGDNESMIGLVSQNPNILVVRTFSKIHAMAGLRIGFVVGHPKTIEALDANYFSNTQITVSNLALAAALASLKDEAHRESCKQKNAEARAFTENALKEMNVAYIPSYTNFIFFPVPGYRGDFAADMLKKNVLLRFNNSPTDKWGRVSIGTLDEMKQFAALSRPLLTS